MSHNLCETDLSGNEKKYLSECIDTGWVSSKGPFVERFEKAWAEYCGTKYAVACSSGTNALVLALAAAGVTHGSKVIVPEFTMVATAWAVTYLGATPVFVDCGDDLNIDPDKIEQAIFGDVRDDFEYADMPDKSFKAIIPVHIYGRPCKMDRIMQIAKKYNLAVIEDAAEAHGATFQGKKVGTIGKAGCFSLFGNKIISSGEGGIIVTDDEEVDFKLRKLRSMWFDDDHTFYHPHLAYNFRMTNLQAAVALAQTERIAYFLGKRQMIRAWYDWKLKQYTIPRPDGSVMWFYDIVLPDRETRDRVREGLKQMGIETRVFFKPMSDQPMYGGVKRELKARDFSERGIYLPCHPGMTESEVRHISDMVCHLLTQ